jgi:putative membrane protein
VNAVLGHTGVDHVAVGVAAAAAIGVYGAAWLRQREPPGWRLAAWTGGVGAIVLATTPWLERAAERSFTGHMVQHVLLIAVAAPLLVLARPLQTVVNAGWIRTTATGRRVGAAWRHAGPIVGPLAFIAVLFVTHLTSVYDRALHDRLVHELEHVAYLIGAVLAWAAVVVGRRTGSVARVGAVFGIGVGGAVLGMALLSANDPLIPTYVDRLGATDALADQRAAAALMWVTGMATTLPLLVIAVWRWAAAEERITRRAEALAASTGEHRPGHQIGPEGGEDGEVEEAGGGHHGRVLTLAQRGPGDEDQHERGHGAGGPEPAQRAAPAVVDGARPDADHPGRQQEGDDLDRPHPGDGVDELVEEPAREPRLDEVPVPEEHRVGDRSEERRARQGA